MRGGWLLEGYQKTRHGELLARSPYHLGSSESSWNGGPSSYTHSTTSEEAVGLQPLELVVIGGEGLIDVVGVGDVPGVLDLLALSLAVGEDLLAGGLISLHHLDGEDVIDLDVVSGDAVVQEVRGEHHVVALVPELGVVLVVEVQDVARPDETETGDDEEGEPEPHEEGGVVQRALRDADYQAREDGSEGPQHVIDLHPVVVDDAEGPAEGVLRVLALAHLEVAGDPPNETASLSETLVVDVLDKLEAPSVQEPLLKSLRHFPFFF